jgi:hypothetical protein
MYRTAAYDKVNDDGFGPDPVVVIVATGTHDVSRLVNLLAGGSVTCELLDVGGQVSRQVSRHNGGRAALALLKAHGGPDLLTLVVDRSKLDRAAASYIAVLEDTVVAAARVLFDEVKGPEANYATEVVHGTASQIVNVVPRLAGAYRGAGTDA